MRQNDRIKMKKKDRIIKKYLAVLTVVLCAFALFAGVSESANRTSQLTRGVSDSVYTEKQILESVAKEAKNGREFLNAIDEKMTEMILGKIKKKILFLRAVKLFTAPFLWRFSNNIILF